MNIRKFILIRSSVIFILFNALNTTEVFAAAAIDEQAHDVQVHERIPTNENSIELIRFNISQRPDISERFYQQLSLFNGDVSVEDIQIMIANPDFDQSPEWSEFFSSIFTKGRERFEHFNVYVNQLRLSELSPLKKVILAAHFIISQQVFGDANHRSAIHLLTNFIPAHLSERFFDYLTLFREDLSELSGTEQRNPSRYLPGSSRYPEEISLLWTLLVNAHIHFPDPVMASEFERVKEFKRLTLLLSDFQWLED